MALGNLSDLESNILGAFRAEWAQVVKVTTGPVSSIAVVVSANISSYVGPAGMFTGFDIGDELTVTGWARAGNNGMKWVEFLSADASTMSVRSEAGATMAAESAGPTVTIASTIPAVQKLGGWETSTETTRPWLRETYQPNNNQSASLSGASAPGGRPMTRMVGLYWLHIMYPLNCGTGGILRLRGKFIARIYPNRGIQFNGQTIRVLSASPKGDPVESGDFVSGAMVFGFQADALNP